MGIFTITLLCSFASPLRAIDPDQLSGTFYYNHTPISEFTNVTPDIYVWDETVNSTVENFTLLYSGDTGAYTIGNLPTNPVTISGYVHATGSAATLPGNFYVYGYADLPQMTPGERALFPIDTTYILHMTSPWDNSGIDFPIPSAGTYPIHPRHIEIHWDPVTGADHYTLAILRYRDGEHPDGYGAIDSAANTTTTETSWSVDLNDSENLEHYQLTILAYNAASEDLGRIFVTYTNGFGTDYRFKVGGNELLLNKMTIKAGKTDGTDSFSLSGWLDGIVPADFVNGDAITVQLGNVTSWTINQPLRQSGSKPKYSFKGTPGVTPNLKFDLDKGTFSISGKKMDLDGLAAPVRVELVFGNYFGWCDAQDEGDNDVINSRKPIPMQFLVGEEDAIRVDKVICKENTQTNTVKSLIVAGGIAMAAPANLSLVPCTFSWDNQPFVIPAGGLVDKGASKFMYVKKATKADPFAVVVTFDLIKCTFQIVMANTNIPWQDSPVVLRIELGSFNQQDNAEF